MGLHKSDGRGFAADVARLCASAAVLFAALSTPAAALAHLDQASNGQPEPAQQEQTDNADATEPSAQDNGQAALSRARAALAERRDCAEAARHAQEALRLGADGAQTFINQLYAPLGGAAALSMPRQVQFDLLEAQTINALSTRNYPEFLANLCALEATGLIHDLPGEARVELDYHRAVALREARRPAAALEALNRYLAEAGPAGASYQEALLLVRPLNAEAAGSSFAAPQEGPALWRIATASNDVYLFGTIHILPSELRWRTSQIDAALADSRHIYFEADALSAAAQAEMAALIPRLGMNVPPVTLTSLISREARANLALIARRLDTSPAALRDALNPYKPWLAGLTVAVMQMQAAGYDTAAGVEPRLKEIGEQSGLSFGYFETIEQQLRFFADRPLETQIADFEAGLAQSLEDPGLADRMVLAWAAGDTDQLDTIFNESMRAFATDYFDVLVVQRNQNWVPQIEGILGRGEAAFIAVGAGHLTGPQGLVSLLRARGYSVEQVAP